MTAKLPWRCLHCWRINKHSHTCCPTCGEGWSDVIDRSFVPQGRGQYNQYPPPPSNPQQAYHHGEWDDGPWNRQERPHTPRRGRPKSPRQQQYQLGQKGKKGQGKTNPGKGAGTEKKAQGKGPSVQEPAPAFSKNRQVQETPTKGGTGISTKGSAPTASSTQSLAEQRLQELTAALQEEGVTLTPKIQGMIADNAAEKTRMTALGELQERNSASAKLYQAKKTLAIAEGARYTLHGIWQKHLKDSVENWKGYTEEFAEQDKALLAQVETARDQVREARKEWNESKESEVEEISDSEETKMKVDGGQTIAEGLNAMVKTLEDVQAKAEAALPEPPAKRSRTSDGAGKLGSNALEPFGGAKR